MPDDAGLISVQFKRKIEYKNYVLENYIEPKKLLQAVKTLVALKHPGYADISINEEFVKEIEKK